MRQRPDYRPDIDGLRAVAIAAVVVFHAFPAAARGGFTGVDVFFVISGYLISRIIWRGLSERSFTLAAFYGRRVLRLFPALVLVLATTLAAGRWLFLPDAYETLGKDVGAAAAFASNLVLWQDAAISPRTPPCARSRTSGRWRSRSSSTSSSRCSCSSPAAPGG